MYSLTSTFLERADAALFNLNLLTSDVYILIWAWLWQGQQFSWLYAVAFALTLSGLALYHTQPTPTLNTSSMMTYAASVGGVISDVANTDFYSRYDAAVSSFDPRDPFLIINQYVFHLKVPPVRISPSL